MTRCPDTLRRMIASYSRIRDRAVEAGYWKKVAIVEGVLAKLHTELYRIEGVPC